MVTTNREYRRRYQWRHHMILAAIFNLIQCSIANPVFSYNPSFSHFQSGRNIRHLPCVVRKSGAEGVCMFAIDCLKSNGTHLGTCIDRFYFGSCCQIKDESSIIAQDIVENSIDQNTISHFPYNPVSQTTASNSYSSSSTGTAFSSSSSLSSSLPSSSSLAPTSIASSSYPVTHRPTPISNRPNHPTFSSSTLEFLTSLSDRLSNVSIASIGSSLGTSTNTNTNPYPSSTASNHPIITTSLNMESKTESGPDLSGADIPFTTIRDYPTVSTTTESIKLQTFQSIQETTTSTTTLPTTTEAKTPTTTRKTTRKTTRRPTTATTTKSSNRPPPANDVKVPATTVPPSTTTKKPVRNTTNTPRPKPTLSKRPATQSTKKPVYKIPPTRRPATTTRRPITTIITTTDAPAVESTRRPTTAAPAAESSILTTTQKVYDTRVPVEPLITSSYSHTTKSPKPRPKPTGEIVTVSPTDLSHLADNEILSSSSSSPSASSLTSSPTVFPSTTNTFSSTAAREPIASSSLTTGQSSSFGPSSNIPLIREPTTTEKPGLVTWSNIVQISSSTEEPTITTQNDWVLLPSVEPTTSTTQQPIRKNVTTAAAASVPASPSLSSTSSSSQTTSSQITSHTKPTARPSNTKPSSIQGSTTTAQYSTKKPIPTVTSSSSSISISSNNANNNNNINKRPAPPSTSSIQQTQSTAGGSVVPSTQPSQNGAWSSSTAIPIEVYIKNATTESIESETLGSIATSPLVSSSGSFVTATISDILTSTMGPLDAKINETSSTGDSLDEDLTTTDIPMAETTIASDAMQMLEGIDYKQVCGRRMFPEPRIVGGSKAAFGRWPWQISLRQWRTSTYLHKCGAALLNENWAITAAHCVDNVPPSDLLLRLGEYDLAEEEEPYGYQERRVQIVASHPQFDPRTFEYDLALLRFYEPVAFQPNIIPVCVPDGDENFIGRTAFVTGWGRLYEDGPLPSVLQEVSVPVINNTICEAMYRNAGYIEHIPHIFICAGWRQGGYDSCEGDSGGPMVIQRDDKRFQLAGVISWGIGCAEPNQPGVYTRISEFKDWINQILQF